MTKPAKIATGIGAAMLVVGGIAVAGGGVVRVIAAWTSLACAVACAAYVANRPAWLGKRDGRLSARSLVVLPYLVAFGIACRLMRWWRPPDRPTRVAPGLWVGGRVTSATLPPSVTVVVDLVAEYGADASIRRLPGYRSLPVLDGGVPPNIASFVALVRQVAAVEGEVLIHCDSGRGRAPTFAAAVLVARGAARDATEAVRILQAARPVATPTRSDLIFLDEALAVLATRAGRGAARAPRSRPGDAAVSARGREGGATEP
jgi:protein-tyrosine phosphatase